MSWGVLWIVYGCFNILLSFPSPLSKPYTFRLFGLCQDMWGLKYVVVHLKLLISQIWKIILIVSITGYNGFIKGSQSGMSVRFGIRSIGLNPSSAVYNLCKFKQTILSLWALVMLSLKLS